MEKICAIATRSLTIKTFFLDNLFYMVEKGYNISVICEFDADLAKILDGKIKYIPVDMKRGNISVFKLIKYIYIFKRIFDKEKFDLIQYASSNASLYASIAGKLANIKNRICCEWGYTYLGYSGIKRIIYKTAEKIVCKFSTIAQPDSFSNLKFGIEEKLFPAKKAQVIWNGSASGVNLKRFDIKRKIDWSKEIKLKYSIPTDAFVFGFVGRLMRDKGINELLEAFRKIDNEKFLLLVGPIDELQDLDKKLIDWAFNNSHIIKTGLVSETEKYYSAMNFLVLPSYREGFGTVLLEAGALKVPSIVSNIRGPIDFVRDNENGFICSVKSSNSLFEKMQLALQLNEQTYNLLCDNVYNDVITKYDSQIFKIKYYENKKEILENKHI